jgi:hypothetical protein
MVDSFKYRIDRNHPVVTLHVTQHFWPRLTKGLLWSAAWSIIAYACVRLFGLTIPSFIGSLVSVWLVVTGYSLSISQLCGARFGFGQTL